MNPWLRFLYFDYYIARLKEWFRKFEPAPEDMTPAQRGEEIGRLIDRANSLCEAERIPGSYIRLDNASYTRFVKFMKQRNDNPDSPR